MSHIKGLIKSLLIIILMILSSSCYPGLVNTNQDFEISGNPDADEETNEFLIEESTETVLYKDDETGNYDAEEEVNILSTEENTDSVVPTYESAGNPYTAEETNNLFTQTNTDFLWFAGHETGNLVEWETAGGFIYQGSGTFHMVTPHAHTGSYSVALTIDTLAPSSTGSHASYLFNWDNYDGEEFYYSAWYYIPSGIKPSDWWSIWQWKSTDNGNGDDSQPMFSVDVTKNGNDLFLRLFQKPDRPDKVMYKQENLPVPQDKWFQIEAFYKKAQNDTGEVIIWQDGVELFHVNGVPTVLSDETLFWSVNNYADTIEPNPCTIYVDDAAISRFRIGTDQ